MASAAMDIDAAAREDEPAAKHQKIAHVVSRDDDPLIAGTHRFRDVVEDAVLGGLTIVGRIVVVVWKGGGLVADGHTRIVVLQSIAAGVALVVPKVELLLERARPRCEVGEARGHADRARAPVLPPQHLALARALGVAGGAPHAHARAEE